MSHEQRYMDVAQLKLEVHRICVYVLRFPRKQRWKILRQEIDKLPPNEREIALSLVTTAVDITNDSRMQSWEKVTVWIAGVLFVLFLLIIAIWIPEPTEFQIFVFRVVLALAAGAVGSVIPGILQVEGRIGRFFLRATGALALFVIIYSINPPALAKKTAESTRQTGPTPT